MPDWKNYSILVVDDSTVQRAFAVDLLREMGFENILQASDGVNAVRVLEAGGDGVDFMLTDLDMPGVDGVELLREVASHRWAQYLIVMSAREAGILDAVEGMASEDDSIKLLSALPKPLNRKSLEDVLMRADLSLDRNKKGAQDSWQATLDELGQALERDEFLPYYQPKVDIATGLLRSVEALARWRHPQYGVVPPSRFIPLLEDSDLMWPFTRRMIEKVLVDLSGWIARGMSFSVAINLPAKVLLDLSLVDKLEKMVQAPHIPPQRLILEVTETMLMNNLSVCIGNLARMRLKGFALSMDDYGIGYSSMQQLSRCPFTELKIDRAFVDGASNHPNRRVILESSIQMGKRLGVTTIAEGVEAEADWRLLKELGCEVAQGFFVSKPMPAEELILWIKNRKAR